MLNNNLIDKYFSGSLSENELFEFEKLCENDPEFKQEVDFLESIKKVAGKEDSMHFKSTLRSFESEISQKHSVWVRPWFKPLISVAAVFVIALGVLLFRPTKNSPDKLFAANFQPSKNVSFPLVRSQGDTSLTHHAFVVYAEKDFREASGIFEKLYATSQNTEFLFYEGNALLALGETNRAIETFKKHLSAQDALSKRSHWYLALAYLKSKDLEQARNELKTFLNSGETFKRAEAELLLEKLE
ncbi:MAG: CDC27 family protein [Draconibacterium sp.]